MQTVMQSAIEVTAPEIPTYHGAYGEDKYDTAALSERSFDTVYGADYEMP